MVIPTFNEKENIGVLIKKIQDVFEEGEIEGSILVIDDNSPDGTAEVAGEMARRYGNIRILKRKGKLGLGSAYREGFGIALRTMKADIVFEMDADLSHDPSFIPEFIRRLNEGCEMVVGSRHIPGGKIQGWSLYRHLVSSTANTLAKTALDLGVSDVTTGFRAYRAETLRKIKYETLDSESYGFQIETLFRCARRGLRVGEVPITFKDRRAGASKLGKKEILQFIGTVCRLFVTRLTGW